MSKSKARKLAEFLRNLTDDAKINTSAVQQDNVVTSRTDLESKANDTEALVTAASVTSYVSNELGEYVHSTHDIPLTFTGDVTGSGTITDMGATSFNLTLDAETLPSQTGHSGKFLTTNGTAASWASLNITNWDTAYGWGNHATQGYLTSIPSEYLTQTEGDTRYVLGSGGYNKSNWDTAYSWGDHSAQGYLTSETHVDSISFSTSTGILTLGRNNLADLTVDLDGRYLTSYTDTNTTYGISAQDVSGGKAIRLTGSDGSTDDVTFAAGSNVTLTRSGDTITIASTDTNTDTNTTDWYVANSAGTNQFKVDKNEKVRFEGSGATSVSFDAATNKVTIGSTDTNTETTTTLTKVGNELRYVNEAGTTQTIDLSLYLDDTNLARILSGTMNSSGVATFTRDDSTTFTVDMSVLLDDTNLSRIVSASWNTSNGVLTLTRNDSTTVSVDLDNRYLTSYTETDTLQSVTARGATTDRDILISKDTATLNIRGTINSANGAYLRLTEAGYQGAFIKYEADANKLYIGTKSTTTPDLSSEVTAISINRGSNSITVPGTVTATNFVGSINYNQITNPPVIDNSVDYINGASFNTSTGVLTLSGVGRAGATVDLDGRYAASSHVHNYMPIQNSTPYRVMSATDWGDFNLGNGTMLQASSVGLPSGGTHGYWFVTGKRDVQEGYVGLYFNHYGSAQGMWIGKNTDGNAAPVWERVFSDSYHPNADKWTTARTHTVTLTGDVSGTASQSVDGTGNKTWTINTNLASHVLEESGTLNTSDAWSGKINNSTTSASWFGVSNTSATDRPTNDSGSNAYAWGVGLSINKAGQGALQVYTPEQDGATNGGMFYRTGWNGNIRSWQRLFDDEYHPNADKWTTARTHTVTLTGQVTGSASQTVDGTGNRTWTISTTLNDSALDDQYVTVGSRHTGDASGLVQPNKASIRIWDVSTSTDKPSGAADGLVLSAGWDSSGWGVQQYHDFHTNDLYLRSKQNGTFSSWDKVFHDTYHPNADKWTNTRTNTVTLTGDVTGSGSASVDGTGNWTVSVAADLTVASTDTFTGTYPIAWLASDNLYKSTWLTINGATDTLNTRNINANGTVTATSFVGSIDYSNITNPPVIDNSVDYINAASFNTSTGVLTLSGVGRAGATVDLDNRYLTSYSETDTLQSVTNRGNTTTQTMIIRESSAGGFEFRTADSWGGWARHTHSISTGGGTHLYGFGGYGGSGTTLSYAYLGKDYQDMNIRMYPDGETQLFYNNSRKLATIAKGVKVGITNAVIGSSVITGDMDTVLEIGVPDGSSASQASNYPSTSGVVFHHGGASTAALKYIQSDANTGIFRFVSDRTNTRIEINNGNTRLHQGSGNSLEVTTNSGWLQLGPQNTGFCHLQSNRDFYFNRRVVVDSGLVESYNEDLYLRRANNSSHQIRIAAGTTTISQNTVIEGNLTVNGSIAQADGFGTLYTFNTTQGLSTSWADVTAIAGGAIPTGTYAIQIKLYNHDASPSGGNYDEHYSGTMSWYASDTNDNDWNEIPLHNAGHAYNGPAVYARTLRRPSGQGGLILQLAASGTVGSDEIQIKLRRLI